MEPVENASVKLKEYFEELLKMRDHNLLLQAKEYERRIACLELTYERISRYEAKLDTIENSLTWIVRLFAGSILMAGLTVLIKYIR